MPSPKKVAPQNLVPNNSIDFNEATELNKDELAEIKYKPISRLEELESMPHRNAALHWAAFTLSLMSLILLSAWVFSSRGIVPGTWVLLDLGLGLLIAIGFFTRSGFRIERAKYLRTHFFDFIALVPALMLVNQGYPIEGVWVWLILIARTARVIDRLLGDGFVRRNILALIEGFEEELTDRVLERIIARIQADMDRACFSRGIADALTRNKPALLQRVRAATPHEGFVPGLVHIVGLDKALEHAEERTYDTLVGIMDSAEVDTAIRDVVSSMFSRMRKELGTKSWRDNLGIRHRRQSEKTAGGQTR